MPESNQDEDMDRHQENSDNESLKMPWNTKFLLEEAKRMTQECEDEYDGEQRIPSSKAIRKLQWKMMNEGGGLSKNIHSILDQNRITSYNVCYTKLLRL